MKKVILNKKQYVLNDFFKVEEAYVQYELYNGEMSHSVRRLNLERGDSAAVLVFNLDTQKIIMVEQFRYPTYQNGHGWLTEIIAGMVDPGETPDESIRRELQEEAGLNISTLEPICSFYPSPGGCSEMIYLYYAEVSGENAKYNQAGGLAQHGEDITSTEISLKEALSKVRSGEIIDAKTIAGVFWLESRQLKLK